MYKKYISTFFSILPKPISNFQSSRSFHLHNSQALFPFFELECCIKETLLNSFRSYCTPMKLRSGDPLETEDAIVQRRGTFFGRCTLQEATTGRENRLEVWYMHACSVSILEVHTSSLFNWDLRGRVPYAASSRAPKASPGDHVDVALALEKDSRSMALNRENLMSSFFLRAKGGVLLPRNMAEVGYIQTFDEFWAGGRRSQLGGDPWVVYGRVVCSINSAKLDRAPGVD